MGGGGVTKRPQKHQNLKNHLFVLPNVGLDVQWGELSKRPQAGVGGMPDLTLQLRVSRNTLRSPAFQEEIVSQVSFSICTHTSYIVYIADRFVNICRIYSAPWRHNQKQGTRLIIVCIQCHPAWCCM